MAFCDAGEWLLVGRRSSQVHRVFLFDFAAENDEARPPCRAPSARPDLVGTRVPRAARVGVAAGALDAAGEHDTRGPGLRAPQARCARWRAAGTRPSSCARRQGSVGQPAVLPQAKTRLVSGSGIGERALDSASRHLLFGVAFEGDGLRGALRGARSARIAGLGVEVQEAADAHARCVVRADADARQARRALLAVEPGASRAAEATLRLSCRLVFGVAALDLVEGLRRRRRTRGAPSARVGASRASTSSKSGTSPSVMASSSSSASRLASPNRSLMTHAVARWPVGDGVDDLRRAGHDVAGGVDVLDRCAVGERIDLDAAAGRQFHAEISDVGALSHCKDHRVGGELLDLVLVKRRGESLLARRTPTDSVRP